MEQYFYITFLSKDKNKDGFVSICAFDSKQASDYAEQQYSGRVCIIYPESIFQNIKQQFSAGCISIVSLVNQPGIQSASFVSPKEDSLYSPWIKQDLKAEACRAGIY